MAAADTATLLLVNAPTAVRHRNICIETALLVIVLLWASVRLVDISDVGAPVVGFIPYLRVFAELIG